MKVYAGIGSRETPQDVLDLMTSIGTKLARRGWLLRSGAADGADSAFEDGAFRASGTCEIFLPWSGYNGRSGYGLDEILPDPNMASRVEAEAALHHPVWSRLTRGPRALHSRNVCILLGRDLDQPVRFVVAWTKGGLGGGGTGQGLRIAHAHSIPVFDLGDPKAYERLKTFIGPAVTQ